jgi:hypothetical protein
MTEVNGSDTSVHVGCFTADYLTLMAKDPEVMPKYAAVSSHSTAHCIFLTSADWRIGRFSLESYQLILQPSGTQRDR